MTSLLHALLVVGPVDLLLVVGPIDLLLVVHRMTPIVLQDRVYISVPIVGMYAMVPRRSLRQIAFYSSLVIVLFNVEVFIMHYAIS